MTNEEKVKEIADGQPFTFGNDNYRLMIEWGAEKMAEWEDKQFKEYLEKKKEAKNLYIKIATEQKAIDIDKACKWLDNTLPNIEYITNASALRQTKEHYIEAFRKALEHLAD